MEPTTQGTSTPAHGSYVWEVPEKPVSIHIALDVVDLLGMEVLRAFSSVPKRGAETGGLLLGTAEYADGRTVVRIRNFELVPCEYRFGPSYLLSEGDRQAFDAAFRSHEAARQGEDRVVGYFRSHTRDGLSLGKEDLSLCRQLFSAPESIVLLVKPFATRVSMAGFLFYENGTFQDEPYVQFPFRRRDLTRLHGGTDRAAEEPPAPVRLPPARQEADGREIARPHAVPAPAAISPPVPEVRIPAFTAAEPPRRRGWLWLPLMLITGALLGWQAARTISPNPEQTVPRPRFSLGLAITNIDDNLRVTWDRQSSAIGAAKRGLLEITDGDSTKQVPLDASQLENGNVTYRHLTPEVIFRLSVFPAEKTRVEETLAWHAAP